MHVGTSPKPGTIISERWTTAREGLKVTRTHRVLYAFDGTNPPVAISAPAVAGFGAARIGVSFSHEQQTALYEYVYETVLPQGSSYGGFPQANPLAHTLQGSLSKSPITLHPKVGQWMIYKNPVNGKRYGRLIGGEIKWELEDPTKAPGAKGGRVGLDPNGSTVTNLNPLYGVTDFYDISVSWTVEKNASKSDLPALLNGVGTIKIPPGAPSNPDPYARNWLYAGITARQNGDKLFVKQTWILSGWGGWERAIYDEYYFSSK